MLVSYLFIALISLSFVKSSAINKGVDFPINENGLVIITDETYREAMKLYDTIFLAFGATWCGMCNRMIPQWAASIKEEISIKYPKVIYAITNGSTNRAVLDYFDVGSYPTFLLIHRNKTLAEYIAHFSTEKLLSFMNEHLIPLGQPVNSIQHLQETIDSNDSVLVYYGSNANDINAISLAMTSYTHMPFLLCDTTSIEHKEILLNYNIVTPRMIVLYKKYDERKNEMVISNDNSITKEMVEEFIKTYSLPLIMEYNQKTSDYVFKKHNSAVFFIQSEQNNNGFKQSDIELIAKSFRGIVQFVLIDSIVSEFNSNFARVNNITIDDLPIVRYYETRNDLNQFDIPRPFDVNSLKISIKNVIDNSEKRITSQPIPAEIRGSVYILEQKTFERDVINNDYDVFVKFYAPWCGHCKQLAPIYEELAKKFATNGMIRIAEIDSTVHNISFVSIQGYPTLVFFPSGNKNKYILYKGDRILEDMEKFINENARNKLHNSIKSDL